MPKYLLKANYTTQGIAGVASKGGSARRDIVGSMVEGVGGSLESFDFAWGDVDAYVIADVPSDEAMASIALSVNQSGAASITTVPLLTPEQVDAAAEAGPRLHAAWEADPPLRLDVHRSAGAPVDPALAGQEALVDEVAAQCGVVVVVTRSTSLTSASG